MKILLDSCAFIDFILADELVSDRAVEAFQSADNELFLSVAAVWEMGLKISVGKLNIDLDESLDLFVQQGVQILDIDLPMTLLVNKLPSHHKDPFDRIIIAAAKLNDMVIMTSDKIFEKYDVELIKSR